MKCMNGCQAGRTRPSNLCLSGSGKLNTLFCDKVVLCSSDHSNKNQQEACTYVFFASLYMFAYQSVLGLAKIVRSKD